MGELLAKYDLKLKTLVGAVAAKYLTKDSAENRGVTKGADTELGWSTELEEANRSLDEAIGYLDLDYPDAADKVRQNRRSRPKGVEEKGKGKGESDRDRTRTPAREPATSSGSAKGANSKGKGAGKGKNPVSDPCDPEILEARRDLLDLNEDALHPEWLSTHYLNTVVEGHKHGGERAFKSWIQTRTGGPVRVSYRAHCRNSWDKCEDALKNHLKTTWVLWGPSHANWELVETKVPQSEWKYFEGYQPHRMLMFLTPPERARTRSAFFVGGWFPDLQASRKSVMTSGQAQQFEDSSKNLDRRDEMLYRALGLKGNFLKKFLKIFVLASSFFQPGAFELTGAKVTVRHPGYKMSLLEDTGWTKQISKEIAKEQPDLVLLTYEGLGDCTELSPSAQEFLGRLATGPAKEVCVLDSFSSCRWKYLEPVGSVEEGEREVQIYQGRGDLAIGSTSQALGEVLVDWSNNDHSKYYTPVSIDTVGDQEGFAECVVLALQESCVEEQVASAFPVEARQEEVVEAGTLDEVVDLRDDKVSFMDEEEIAAEADFLDTLPLAGFPQEESERRREWARIPRRVRLGIRRLHNMMSHKPKEVMIQVLRGAGASDELINAAKVFKCETCRVSDEGTKTHPVSAPPPYEFNHTVSVDVFETADSTGQKYSWLNIVDNGTCYQVVTLVKVGGGQPSSAKCLKKFMAHWASPFGWPKIISHDRGLHNRGAFAHGLAAHGCQIRQAGLESPEHIGRCERHGGIIKRAYRRIVRQHNLSGKAEVKEAMLEAQVSKNEFLRVGGFAPVQWVLGRLPRGVGHILDEEELGQLGVLAGMQDPSSAFGRRAEFRHTARKAYVKQDCSRRVRSAILRKAAGRYQAGDLVCYRISREGNASWSTVAKIIGFDHKTVWVVHQGVPVATSLGRLRPCTSAEVLAYQVLNRGNLQFEHVDAEREQRRYIDAREDVRLDDPDDAEIASATPGAASAAPPGPSLAAERAVRRRVGPTAEESRAVARETVEEPEDEAQAGDDLSPEVPETSSGTSSETGVEVEAADTPEAASALINIAEAAFANLADYNVVISEAMPGTEKYEDFRAFFSDRLEEPAVKEWKKRKASYVKKKQKEKNGKLLDYSKCSDELKRKLDETRAKEWAKWKEFGASVVIDSKQLKELLDEGHQVIPTQWVELDKNYNKRMVDPTVEEKLKSRLVVRGDLEKGDPRSDSPTASLEAQNMVFSFAASRRLKIKCLDVTNAYFQGEEIDRVLLLSQPKGGLPGMEPDEHMLARAPIYGSVDGGRRFWKKLRRTVKRKGLRENRICRALYSYTDKNGVVQMLLTSHVDDLLWACDPSCDWIVKELIDEFKCGTVESGSFKYCGKEIVQDEDFTIHVSCADTTRAIKKIPIAPRRRPGDPLTDSDKTQLKSVAGSLAWVSRQCRPDLAYRVSKIQTASNKGTVADLRQANKSIEYAQDTYQRGLVFKSGVLDWETPGGLVQVVVTDASHANEEEEMLVNGMVSTEGHRSQGARMVFLASPDIWNGNKGFVHPIAWASNVVRRVCRSTIQAEAYTLQSGMEDGDVIRAAVTDLFGKLDLKKWQATSAAFIKQLWLTDCKSLEETLQNPKCAKHSDKRLSIEIASLRQDLWRQKGQETGDPFEEDYKPKDADLTDKVRWIDTDVMIADPLTKVMEPVKLVHVLETNELDVEQPLDSVLKKRAKQLQRRKGDPEGDT